MFDNLKKYKIFLASKSPRRYELLSQLRIPFNTINIGGIDETYPLEMDAEAIPEYLSRKKGEIYISNFSGNELIITADTLVILNNQIMGKPKDAEDAKKMLQQLSGETHKVITGVCLTTRDKQISIKDITEVKFKELRKEEIDYYIGHYLPFDKAGSYGIQEWIGLIAVDWIRGSYYNVMGLPVHKLYEMLAKL